MSCHVCEAIHDAPDDRRVLDLPDWSAYQIGEVPGWITLAPKVHVEGPDQLTDAQAGSLGEHLRHVGRAIRMATGAERIHVVYLGESARHFHASLFPRRFGQPPLLGNERLIAELAADADPDGAATARDAIRAAL